MVVTGFVAGGLIQSISRTLRDESEGPTIGPLPNCGSKHRPNPSRCGDPIARAASMKPTNIAPLVLTLLSF